MVVEGTRGDRVHRPGGRHPGHRRLRRQGRHHLGQGVRYRGDDAEYGALRVISGGDVVVAVARVEPDFVAAAGALHRYEGAIRGGAAPARVTDRRLRNRLCGARRYAFGKRPIRVRGGGHRGALLAIEAEDRIAADQQIAVRTGGQPGGLAIVDREDRSDGPSGADLDDRSGDAGPVSRAVYFRKRDIEGSGDRLKCRLLGAVGRVDAVGRTECDFDWI